MRLPFLRDVLSEHGGEFVDVLKEKYVDGMSEWCSEDHLVSASLPNSGTRFGLICSNPCHVRHAAVKSERSSSLETCTPMVAGTCNASRGCC